MFSHSILVPKVIADKLICGKLLLNEQKDWLLRDANLFLTLFDLVIATLRPLHALVVAIQKIPNANPNVVAQMKFPVCWRHDLEYA